MIVIVERDESKRLQDSVGRDPPGVQHFRHAMHGAGLGLEGNLNEVPFAEWAGQIQETSGDGNGLKFGFGALAVFQFHQGQG